MFVNGRFATDDDLLTYEPHLEDVLSRKNDDTGEDVDSWGRCHDLATRRIEQSLRSMKTLPPDFALGRIGQNTQNGLKDCAACFALYYLFTGENVQNSQFIKDKADNYFKEGVRLFELATQWLEYDQDGNGRITEYEVEKAPILWFRSS